MNTNNINDINKNYQLFPQLPEDLNHLIFSYIPIQERANTTQLSKETKVVALNITKNEQQFAIKSLVKALIDNIDKSYKTIIEDLKKFLKPQELISGSHLLAVKENAIKVMFALALIVKDVPYQDLNIEKAFKTCEKNLPVCFEKFPYIVNLLKMEKRASDTYEVSVQVSMLGDIATHYVYLGLDYAKNLINLIIELKDDLQENDLIHYNNALRDIFETCLITNQLDLAYELLNKMTKVSDKCNVQLHSFKELKQLSIGKVIAMTHDIDVILAKYHDNIVLNAQQNLEKIEDCNLLKQKYPNFHLLIDFVMKKDSNLILKAYLIANGHFQTVIHDLPPIDDDSWEKILILEANLHKNSTVTSFLDKIINQDLKKYVAHQIIYNSLLRKGFLNEAQELADSIKNELAVMVAAVPTAFDLDIQQLLDDDNEEDMYDISKEIEEFKKI
ncbi:hypothetical protein BN1013_01890 [Candidatus Rubidus massiliensis]|nr:hypothetical protein BN1013_01890 [Candidatus Rubidus massiliensis]